MTPRNERERLQEIWRAKLHAAEEAYGKAMAQTRQLQAELPFLPPSDGNLALSKVLEMQRQAIDEYARVLQTFTRLIVYGEIPNEDPEIKSPELKPVTDFDIQEWVFQHHGFVPHPAWIADCEHRYLGTQRAERSQECPADKQAAIREAFVALGMLGI